MISFFFFNDTATTEIYTLSLHDALPILVLRADSRGSVEALRDSLMKLSNGEVAVNIIQAAAGAITESDIKLASASNAIIIGFNVRPTTKALREAELANVEIRTSRIIYHITEDIEKALSGMLEPEYKEVYLGRIEIKKVYRISKVGNIAGCIVVDGKVDRKSTRLNSSHANISYAVFCLKKKNKYKLIFLDINQL